MSTLLLLVLTSFLTFADFLSRVNGVESEVKIHVQVSFVSYVDDDQFAQSVFNQITKLLGHADIVLDPLAQTSLPSVTIELSPITNEYVEDAYVIDLEMPLTDLSGLSPFLRNRTTLEDVSWYFYPDTWHMGLAIDRLAGVLAFHLGNHALLNEAYEEAVELFESSLYFLDLGFCEGLYHFPENNLAWVLTELGNTKQAIALVDRYAERAYAYRSEGIRCDIPLVNQLTIRARLYSLVSDFDAALLDMNAAIEIIPEKPDLYTQRGQIYLSLYEWDAALTDYNTALELDPDYAAAYFYRGILYYSILQTGQELRQEALADFQQYLILAPKGPFAAQAQDYIATIEAELAALNE